MGSKKRSARRRELEAFRAELGGMNDVFAQEEQRRSSMAARREAAHEAKACTSKQRYANKTEAEAAIVACAEHGRTGLTCYRCSYCRGWHLTSHPWSK